LTHLFARPSLASEIDTALLQPDKPESEALSELIGILRGIDDPDRIDDAMLAELIRDARHAEALARAHAFLRIELKLEEDDAVAAFRELLEALRKREPEEHRRLREKVLK